MWRTLFQQIFTKDLRCPRNCGGHLGEQVKNEQLTVKPKGSMGNDALQMIHICAKHM